MRNPNRRSFLNSSIDKFVSNLTFKTPYNYTFRSTNFQNLLTISHKIQTEGKGLAADSITVLATNRVRWQAVNVTGVPKSCALHVTN